jgi:signal transduction histidine kinase
MERAFRPERLMVAEPEPRALPWWVWPVAAASIFATAVASVAFISTEAALAAWWPAGGMSVWLLLAAGRERRWAVIALVFVITVAANMTVRHDILPSLFLGMADAAEMLAISLLLHRRATYFRLGTMRDAWRFVVALTVGSAVVGVCVAGIVAAAPGGEGFYTMGFPHTASHIAASHLSSTLLIAPFAVLPPRMAEKVPRVEMVVQTLLVATTIAFVFAPGMYLPLSFLPFAFIVWAAFRFPVRFALGQALAASMAVLVLTLLGGGPFASAALPHDDLVLVIELYVIVIAVLMTLMVTARNEVRQTARTALSVSQLVTGGFVASRVGLVIAEEHDDTITVLWANRAGVEAIEAELTGDGTWDGPLADNVRRSLASGVETMHEARTTGTTISLLANRIPGDESRLSVQLVDVGAAIRMAEARHEAELERAAARSSLVDLERQREDFVATTSHELRTPITSIAGYAELLSESSTLSPTERSWVQVIQRNAERLTVLVEDLLTLGRAGNAAPEASSLAPPLNLRELAREIAAMHQPMADARRITLEVDVDPEARARWVLDDAGRALGNLVANAVKFTPPGGSVRVTSSRHDGRVALTVTDTGPGMSPDTLAHAFERFYRGPDAVHANTPGTGLGLAITAQLAERNGGSVHLSSPPGEGLTATLVFGDPGT